MSFQPDNILAKKFDQDWVAHSVESKGNQGRTSLLVEGCTVRGAFECKGDFTLEGFIEGDVVVEGVLTVGETAVVRANVRAKSAIVFGRVIGDLLISDHLQLHSGSQVRGNIKTRRLLIQDGVVFDGRCEMSMEKKSEQVE